MAVFLNVPIEPIENRYSTQWDRWFRDEISYTFDGTVNPVKYFTITGIDNKNYTPSTNLFLDPFRTNEHKSLQMATMIRIIKEQFEKGELDFIVLLHDLWFPGIEKLKYIESMLDGVTISINGVFHAGTWDPADLTSTNGMGVWADKFEMAWIGLVDKIFVATAFHADLIAKFVREKGTSKDIENFLEKTYVTFLPFYPDKVVQDYNFYDLRDRNIEKAGVVFPHRLSFEKGIDLLDEYSRKLPLWFEHPEEFEIYTTIDKNLSKKEYYDTLKSSRYSLSLATQETFGISMIESVFAGCIPIVPDALAYKETIFSCFRYPVENPEKTHNHEKKLIKIDVDSALSIIDQIEVNNYFKSKCEYMLDLNIKSLTARCASAIPRMIELCFKDL